MEEIAETLKSLPWSRLASPIAAAEDALARLDERLAQSPIRDGFIARTQFMEAAACLWLEGELVALEDLALHDCDMDIRAPTHALARAHAILRARRRIAEARPDWALSPEGLVSLQGRGGDEPEGANIGKTERDAPEPGRADETQDDADDDKPDAACRDDDLANLFADLDAAIARADQTLNAHAAQAAAPPRPRNPLLYDPDHDAEARLAAWRDALHQTRALPPTLAAALSLEAWETLQPLEHRPWLGPLLVAALLRARGKARHHLPCLAVGLKTIARNRRRASDATERLIALIAAIEAAAGAGLADHDRWIAARAALLRKIAGRRAHSKISALVDYVLARPMVSAAMIAQELRITPRAAQNLVADLGLREATGRARYRAWGIL